MAQFSRTGGHGYTYLEWRGNPILYVQQTTHVAPAPISAPAAIQPMNHLRPLEIAGPRAIGHGVLTLSIIEGWKDPIWKQLSDFAHSSDLADIFQAQNSAGTPIQVQKIIFNPASAKGTGTNATQGSAGVDYVVITYHGCKIADVRDGETVDLTTIQVNKDFDIWYTHSSREPNLATGGGQHTTASVQDQSTITT